MDRVRGGDDYDALDLVFAWALQRLRSHVEMAHPKRMIDLDLADYKAERDDTELLDCCHK